jgi:hypothetical protein
VRLAFRIAAVLVVVAALSLIDLALTEDLFPPNRPAASGGQFTFYDVTITPATSVPSSGAPLSRR